MAGSVALVLAGRAHLPDRSGLEVVRELKAIDPSTHVVVLTGYGSIATALEAIRLGALHYLTKPADADRILAAFDLGPSARPPLADCGGNVSEAARVLNMHRRSLQRKLAKRP